MNPLLSRKQFLSLSALLAGTAAVTACTTGSKTGNSAGGNTATTATSANGEFPVTITHAFGSTTIEQQPQRMAAIGWINGDIAASLGVIPVAQAKITWGGNAAGSLDWFDAKVAELGNPETTRFDETDGLNFTAIAASNPDVILAVVGQLSQEDYDKLSAIAPVVTYKTANDAWQTPWDEATLTIGKALGKTAVAQQVVADLKAKFSAAGDTHPEILGASFIAAALATSGDQRISLYGKNDVRSVFFTDLGLTMAPVVAQADFGGQFYTNWSPERASELNADVLYSWVSEEADIEKIAQDPLLSQIPAVAHGAFLGVADKTENMALGCSPLGMNWLLDETDFVSRLAAAISAGKGAA